MHLSDLLPLAGVKLRSSITSKKRLFQDLGELADSCFGLCAETVVDALVDRENLGPTGVGSGVALPHARISSLPGVRGLFMRLETPLEFNAVDRQPVDLVFALFSHEDAGVEHLKALALVSRTLRDESICAKLRANSDPATLHTILTEDAASQAA